MGFSLCTKERRHSSTQQTLIEQGEQQPGDRQICLGINIRNSVSVTGQAKQRPGDRKICPGISGRNLVSVTGQGDQRPGDRKGG